MKQILEKILLCEALEKNDLKTLANFSVTRTYPKNSIIITEGDEGDSLYVIQSGKVKIFLMNNEGKEVTLNYHGQNEYFGEVAMLDDQPRSASVITLELSKFTIISKRKFWSCMENYPEIAFNIIRKQAMRLRELTDNVKRMALMDVYGRLVKVLNEMAVEQDGELVVREPLTQQDLSNLIGSSREMVTRILKDLVSGGYLHIKSKKITIIKRLPAAW